MHATTRTTVRFTLWAVVVCASHATIAFMLFGVVLAFWFLIGGSYESKALQFGVASAFFIPFASDYPISKWIMNSRPIQNITESQK